MRLRVVAMGMIGEEIEQLHSTACDNKAPRHAVQMKNTVTELKKLAERSRASRTPHE
jgi:hypothetical protein